MPDKIGWTLATLLYLGLAVWLFSLPPSIAHDDAFFFLQGIERFSVLEFRPHFPGYPGFILLGKGIAFLSGGDADRALWFLSNICALLIVPLTALSVSKNRLAAFFLALSCPLLPLVGVSMMSDGAGIAFFLAAIWQYRCANRRSSGVLLGVMLAVRPSFVVVVAAFVLCDLVARRFRRWDIVFFSSITCLSFYIGVFAWEGGAYIWEGWRFIEGHFTLWGNTRLNARDTGWLDLFDTPVFASYLLLLASATIWAVIKLSREKRYGDPVLWCLLAAWGWTLLFQNPENLRHLLLPIVLSLLVMVPALPSFSCKTLSLGLVLCSGLVLFPFVKEHQSASPLVQVHDLVRTQGESCLLTNRGVAYLRASLPDHHIFDAYYDYALPSPCLRLTADKVAGTEGANILRGRVFGENALYLSPVKSVN